MWNKLHKYDNNSMGNILFKIQTKAKKDSHLTVLFLEKVFLLLMGV